MIPKRNYIFVVLFALMCFSIVPIQAQKYSGNATERQQARDSLMKIYGHNEDFERLEAQMDEIVAKSEANEAEQKQQRIIIFWASLLGALLPWLALVRAVWKNPSLLHTPRLLLPDVIILSVLTLVLFLVNYSFLWMRAEFGRKFYVLIIAIALFSLLGYCVVAYRHQNKKLRDLEDTSNDSQI